MFAYLAKPLQRETRIGGTMQTKYILSGLFIGVVACGGEPTSNEPQPTPDLETTSFVSADGLAGQQSPDEDASFAAGADGNGDEGRAGAPGAGETRTVEEGDIYRLGPEGLVYNLNTYRGLQIIDVSDPTAPEVVGRARIFGTPVEMYQVDDVAVVLLNGAHAYYGSRQDVRAERYEGGLVVTFDVRDPKRPRRIAQARVPGWIRTSRLTRGGGGQAVYVAASDGDRTYVASFRLSGADLQSQSELDLGGWVQDIQATTSHLLVSSHDYRSDRHGSQVTIIDISDPTGVMVRGATVEAAGRVPSKFNMDVHGDMLRIVSGNSWGDARNTNHAETYDISDVARPARLDSETFGDNEDLYATLFMEDRAFFVTYRRVDPFHAFSIAPDGTLTERSEFVVSGWNDFFFPVEDGRRLVGIGTNDQSGWTKAVSLYDITDLDNPEPLLVRREVDMEHSWSEANWDDRAVSVLEDAVSVEASDGTLETGLVLLPYQGWDSKSRRYETAVQLFTFSEETLTRRGIMRHETPVRRSFLVDRDQAANLSESALSVHDTSDPDAPSQMGKVELAPYIKKFLPIDSRFGLRVVDPQSWYGYRNEPPPRDRIEVVRLTDDVENAEPVATFEVDPGSFLFLEGSELRVVSALWDWEGRNEPRTRVEVWDLSDPTRPVRRGVLEREDLPLRPVWGGMPGLPYEVRDCASPYCWGWGLGGLVTPNVLATEDALVFIEAHPMSERIGTYEIEIRRPRNGDNATCWDSEGPRACTFVTGSIRCSTLVSDDGTRASPVCSGGFHRCEQDAEGQRECSEIDAGDVSQVVDRYRHDATRHWQRWDLHVVDLRDPNAPTVSTEVSLPRSDEAITVVGGRDRVHLNVRRPHTVPNDPRPYVKYWVRELDLRDPDRPRLGAYVNIPGQLLSVDGDRILTRDFLWGHSILETSINQLERVGNRARLRGVRRFEDEVVDKVVLDGAGLVLVSHRDRLEGPWYGGGYVTDDVAVGRPSFGGGYARQTETTQLSLLDGEAPGLVRQAQVEVDGWATLQSAKPGRALFQVPGGMLVMNTAFPTAPFAQAFFPVHGWPSSVEVQGDDIFVAAGPFGLYRFDSDTFNLWAR